jgi:hypothetical protein
MGKYFNIAIAVVITFVVTLTLNTAVEYFDDARGTVSVSDATLINGQAYVTVTCSNYTDNLINGLLIKTPKTVAVSDIFASEQVDVIESFATTSSKRYFQISKIPPHTLTRLTILVSNQAPDIPVSVMNAESLGLKFKSEYDLTSHLWSALKNALIAAAIYAMIMFIFYYLHEVNRDKIYWEFKQLSKETKSQNDLLRKRTEDVESYYTKMKLLLLARISDYSKELFFWRDTIRLMAVSEENKKNAEGLINKITEHLKTYSTKTDDLDLDAVKIAAAWIAEEEKR